jgi:hypothetical protein
MTANEIYLSDLIGRCFSNGLIEDFESMMDFIAKCPEKRKILLVSIVIFSFIRKYVKTSKV